MFDLLYLPILGRITATVWRQLLRARYCPSPSPYNENPPGLCPLLFSYSSARLFASLSNWFGRITASWPDHQNLETKILDRSQHQSCKLFSTRNLPLDIPTLTNWAKNRAAFMSQLFTLVTYILSLSSLHVYQKAPRTSRAAAIAIRIKDNESFVRVTFPKSCCEDGVWLQPRITNLNGLILYDRSRKRDGRYFSCTSTSMHEIRELWGGSHLSELTGQDIPIVMKILLLIIAIQPDQ